MCVCVCVCLRGVCVFDMEVNCVYVCLIWRSTVCACV